MERGAGGAHPQHAGAALSPHNIASASAIAAAAAASRSHDYDDYMTSTSNEEPRSNSSSFDNPANAKKKPPKLKSINRSMSMAIDNYAPQHVHTHTHDVAYMPDNAQLIVEQPLIHRSASPLPMRSAPPPQTLHLPSGGGGSGAVSPALSARHKTHMLSSFQQLASQARQQISSSSSPIGQQQAQHPDIFLVSSSSLGDGQLGLGNSGGGGSGFGGSSSPIQFIDDYMLPQTHHVTHPLKKSMFRRSDTIDVHPASTFQMKKTHSFHAPHDATQLGGAVIDPLLLTATNSGSQASSGASSRRTSSVRGNFLMPGQPGADRSRSPSPNRRGYRSHRSFNDPQRRPSNKPDSVVDSQIRHPSLNDDLIETMEDPNLTAFPGQNLSLENELFIETRSRSNSHTKMDDVGKDTRSMRKSSGSFDDPNVKLAAHSTGTHPPPTSSSLKKRDIPHARQHSTHSLEFDGRSNVPGGHVHVSPAMQLHSAATAAQAAYHFKRGAQHGRSLYLSPNNLEELPLHRPGVLAAAAAAAFQGNNASASVKQARALHSASMRLRTYRETLSASKKSKSFIADSGFPAPGIPAVMTGNEFELTSPHRRNSRPLSSAVSSGEPTVEDIKRSPRPLTGPSTSAAAAAAAAAAFIEEKRPSFERKPSLTYELSDAAFEQVLRPFHQKVAGRKGSMSGSHKALKKKSLSDETDEEAEADRKRKRIVCIVMTVFLCLVCASVLVVILTLTHSSGQSHHHHQHQTPKKIYTFTRETPVHYNVRQENERLMKETMERARYGKNFTESASLISSAAQLMTSTTMRQQQQHQQHQQHQQQPAHHQQQPQQHQQHGQPLQ